MVPKNVLRNLYFSLVYSYLNYVICIWGGTYQSHLQKIIILQKRILRIMNNASFYSHTHDLFRENGILKFTDIYTLNLCIYAHKNFRTSMRNEIE